MDVRLQRHIAIAIVLACTAANDAIAFACGAKTDPFAVGERGTPTPTALAGATVAPTAVPPWMEEQGRGLVRIAEWPDRDVQLANALSGYAMVHGYGYSVEIVPLDEAAANEALLRGEVDVVAMLDRAGAEEWYSQGLASGVIVDLGAMRDADPGLRVVATAKLQARAADLADFFGRVSVNATAFDGAAAAISEGRTGVSPVVAALIYYKDPASGWQAWMPAEVADAVSAAIADGQSSLKNRGCIPTVSCGAPKPRNQ
ncbi:MAG: hypothetical protein FJ319_13945 [SAR202 cluster bacterium]|nr:hypothetical protein [SAR202 cluster bacterium]